MFIKFIIREDYRKFLENRYPQFVYYVGDNKDTSEQSINKSFKEHNLYNHIGFIVDGGDYNHIKEIVQGIYKIKSVRNLLQYLDGIRNADYSMTMICIDARYDRRIIEKVAESYGNIFFKNSPSIDLMNRSFKSRYNTSNYIGQLVSAYDDDDRLPKLCTDGFHGSSTFFDACYYQDPVALLKMIAKSPVDYGVDKSCCRYAIFEYMGEIKSPDTVREIERAVQIVRSNKNKKPSRKSFICIQEHWGRIGSSVVGAVNSDYSFRYGNSRIALSADANLEELEMLYKRCFSNYRRGSGFYEGGFVLGSVTVIDEEREKELKEFKKEFIKAFNKNHWDRWRKAISPLKKSEFDKKFISLSFL